MDSENFVISGRIRLARNFSGVPFCSRITQSGITLIETRLMQALGDGYKCYTLADLGEIESGALVEKHVISKELLSANCGKVIVCDDEEISLMLGEEDHLRLQVIKKGYDLYAAYCKASAIDDIIDRQLKYAFDQKLGYLTACPTNLGTGLRASVMTFLPALTIRGEIAKLKNKLAEKGVTLRGVYGEGSDALGYIYQISNQRTLGASETQLIELVQSVVSSVITAESEARDYLFDVKNTQLTDEILRAVGTVKYAYKISNDEFIRLSALIKLGAYYGLIAKAESVDMDELLTRTQPYNLILGSERDLYAADEQDVARANIIKKAVKGLVSTL